MIQSYYKAYSEKLHGWDEENYEEFQKTYESPLTIARMPLSLALGMFPYVLKGSLKTLYGCVHKVWPGRRCANFSSTNMHLQLVDRCSHSAIKGCAN